MRFTHEHNGWGDDTDRPRVLLECNESESPSIIADLITRNGYEVRVCHGPDDHRTCDLIADGACELVDGADAVVNMLGVRKEAGRAVAEVVLSQRRPPKVIVEVAQIDLPVEGLDLQDASIITTPVTSAALIRSIDEVFAEHPSPLAWWGDGTP